MSNLIETQVVVVGGGAAGLAASCLAAKSGLSVALVSGSKSSTEDPRTVALMMPALRLLQYLDIWPEPLSAFSAALKTLRIIDDTGRGLVAPDLKFSSSEIGQHAFGWNVPLGRLCGTLQNLALRLGVKIFEQQVETVDNSQHKVSLRMANGACIDARVIIAADGRHSICRRSAGISTTNWFYEQTAVVTSFSHSRSHHDTSFEFHQSSGPFTTVPLSGKRSSLVWMVKPDKAKDLKMATQKQLTREIQLSSHGKLGQIVDVAPLHDFPMSGLTAKKFAANRCILVGEAAHVVPPIGAQGLNMTLRDVAHACQLLEDAEAFGDDIGSEAVMNSYHEARRADVVPRQGIIHGMNASLLADFDVLHSARALAMLAIDKVTPLKRAAMKEGLAPSANLPRIMLSG